MGLAADSAVVPACTAPMEQLIAGRAQVFDTILAVDQHFLRLGTLLCLAFFADSYSEMAITCELLGGLFFPAREWRHCLFHVGGEFCVDVLVGELGAVAQGFRLEDEAVLLGEI